VSPSADTPIHPPAAAATAAQLCAAYNQVVHKKHSTTGTLSTLMMRHCTQLGVTFGFRLFLSSRKKSNCR